MQPIGINNIGDPPAPTPKPLFKKGDINCDGTADVEDLLLKKHVLLIQSLD